MNSCTDTLRYLFPGSSGRLILKNVKETSMPFIIICKEKLIKAGRFSFPDEVFIWKILSLLLPGRDAKHPGFI